jgi:aspartyl-tRNA(Asn)/glutamyl-tRNA(Gln) amidotransferase subunit C
MPLSAQEVEHVAHLARLTLTEEEINQYARQLTVILDYIENLKALDISEVEPTSHGTTQGTLEREDLTTPSLPRDLALSNAPQEKNEQFLVPPVLNPDDS